jgi:hypothetical protein
MPKSGGNLKGCPTTVRRRLILGEVMGAFRSFTAIELIRGVRTVEWLSFAVRLPQRNNCDYVVRDADPRDQIRQHRVFQSGTAVSREKYNTTVPEQKDAGSGRAAKPARPIAS